MDLKIVRSFCRRSDNPKKRVEFFWSEPAGIQKKPLVILVHGHNVDLRCGARTDLFTGMFEYFADNELIAVSMSQPGYAGSDGPPDYCGPNTHSALESVIDYFYEKKFVDSDRIVIYGLSRGATVAALTASKDKRIKALIMTAGLYNLLDGYDELSDGIKRSLELESGTSSESLKQRSPYYLLNDINIPSPLIHGEQDEIAHAKWAKQMHEAALIKGKDFQLELFKKYGHGIPFKTCAMLAGKFLKKIGFIESPRDFYRLSFEPSPELSCF